MRKIYTRQDIEALISDDAGFSHECFSQDREYENESFKWAKDGSCVIAARKGKKVNVSSGKDDYHAPYYD
jgi:hypothetical protein